ncbi:unnamed protein product, partial [Staurois parvus]
CPIVGVSGGGIVPHCWCQWGRNSAPSLVSVGRIVSPSLVSVGRIVPHHWCQCGGGIVPHHWCQCGGGI